MEFTTSTKPLSEISTDLLVLRFFEGEQKFDGKIKELDKTLGGLISGLIHSGDFNGELGETFLLLPPQKIGASRLLLLGLGQRGEYDLEKLRAAVAALAPLIQKLQIKHMGMPLKKSPPPKTTVSETVQAMVEALLLSNYKFTEYKKLKKREQPAPLEEIHFILNQTSHRAQALQGAFEGEILAKTVNFVRDLGNHPANVATPNHLAEHAKAMSKKIPSLEVKILDRAGIKKENMGAVLAVAAGSDEEPKFLILEYSPKKTAPTVVLVGKGITFDSGGLSIKPAEKMEEMKNDMAGAATVMGIIQAAALLKLPINLVGLIPATENLPSGKATKPGDIVRSRSGQTIEIVNTDAEGRLVLADALDYAKPYRPDLVIDFATLTGAIIVALGDNLIGAFSNREGYWTKLKAAATKTGEKIWPMPLEKTYEELIKSEVADLRNIGITRFGDAINAAIFLQHFVDYPWIHLDVAGVDWASRDLPYRPKGATGTGVRLAIEFLKNFRKQK